MPTALNGWSAGEVVPIAVLIAVMVLALRFNRGVAKVLSGFTSYGWPPTKIPREDRPEKLAEHRSAHTSTVAMLRVAVILFATAVIVMCVFVLLHGPD